MHHSFLSFALTASLATAQYQCNVNSAPPPPSFHITCPCPGSSGGTFSADLDVSGVSTINSTIRVQAGSLASPLTVLFIGLPATAPTPIPPAVVSCYSGTAVNTLHVTPLSTVFVAGEFNFFLYVPNQPTFIGTTLAFQSFELQPGLGSVPFYPSAVVGMTITP